MFFIDKEHENTFFKLLNEYSAVRNYQYRCALYVLSIPDIYTKASKYITGVSNPMAFYFDMLDEESDIKIDFTSAHWSLLALAANLWNGADKFNLDGGLGLWDEDNYQAFLTAVRLRREGYEMIQDHLRNNEVDY